MISVEQAKFWAKQCFDMGRQAGKTDTEFFVCENGTEDCHTHIDKMIDKAISRMAMKELG